MLCLVAVLGRERVGPVNLSGSESIWLAGENLGKGSMASAVCYRPLTIPWAGLRYRFGAVFGPMAPGSCALNSRGQQSCAGCEGVY